MPLDSVDDAYTSRKLVTGKIPAFKSNAPSRELFLSHGEDEV